MSYLGNSPPSQNFVAGADQFSGTGSQTVFTLSRNVNTVFDIFVTVSNVPQDPFSAYTVSGNTLTFDGAPPSGTNNIDVVYRATNVQTFVPTPGVSTQLGLGSASAPSLTFIGDTNTGIYSPAADTWAVATGGTEALRVNSAQNVGIGTSSPTNKLHVLSTSSEVARFIRDNTSNASGGITIGNNSRVFTIYGDNSALSFWDTTAAAQRMTLDASGNLGIGQTNPSNPLHIYAASAPQIRIQDANGSFYVGRDSSNNALLNMAQAYAMIFQTSGTERARITSGGNLLVGQTADSQTTVGNIAYGSGGYSACRSETTNSTSTYTLYSTGASAFRFYVGMGGTINATSTTITGISDVRLKENIRDLDDGLDAVMALKPRKFDWKEGKGANTKDARGFIAQEFEEVFPDMIEQWMDEPPEGEEPYKAVNANLIPTLVKAIQEQQAMIDEMKAEIAALKAQP